MRWVLASRAQLLRAIKTLYGVGAETFDELLKARGGSLDDLLTDKELVSDINANDPEASVVKFVNQIIREAIAERATDIHVEPLENDLRIRYRIDGILHEAAVPPQLRVLQNAIISRLKVMARMDIAEKRLPQDGRINLRAGTMSIDVRVSTIPTVNGESISLRLLSGRDRESFGFEKLDLDEHQTKLVKALLAQPNGIVMVTGPTGSGKSTTLYSFLTSINTVQRRIITIEEPVEYRLPGRVADRRETRDRVELRQGAAAHPAAGPERHHGRRDPRRRDGRHRHPRGADGTPRFLDAAHQRRRGRHHAFAGHGHRAVPAFEHGAGVPGATARADDLPALQAPAEYRRRTLREMNFPEEWARQFQRGTGCDHCRQTGYQGRMAIHEICVITDRLRQADRRQGGRQPAQGGGGAGRHEDAAPRRLAARGRGTHDGGGSAARHAGRRVADRDRRGLAAGVERWWMAFSERHWFHSRRRRLSFLLPWMTTTRQPTPCAVSAIGFITTHRIGSGLAAFSICESGLSTNSKFR